MIALLAAVTYVGALVVRVVQSRIEDDGGRADDDPVHKSSSASASVQSSSSLQDDSRDLRSAALKLLGPSSFLLPSAATALAEDRCRFAFATNARRVEEAIAAEPAHLVANPTPPGEAVDLLREHEAIQPYCVEDRPDVGAVVAGLPVARLGRRDHVG